MREIKFRGWNTSTAKMLDLKSLTPLALDVSTQAVLDAEGATGLFIPFTSGIELMQYTGLKDKNSVEIYEGDIVEHEGTVYAVEYAVGDCRWCCLALDDSGHFMHERDKAETVVVGNIHQNPELLTPIPVSDDKEGGS